MLGEISGSDLILIFSKMLFKIGKNFKNKSFLMQIETSH